MYNFHTTMMHSHMQFLEPDTGVDTKKIRNKAGCKQRFFLAQILATVSAPILWIFSSGFFVLENPSSEHTLKVFSLYYSFPLNPLLFG